MIVEQLIGALGAETVLRGDACDARYLRDWTARDEVRPLAVVLPRSTAEVATALRLCDAAGVGVVPQGGLTGLVGGAMPLPGAIALNLSRLAPAPQIDLAAGTATVGAGTVLQTLQEAAARHGLTFPVDFGARGSCQIGGMIATNAGGVHVLHYGMMRAQVLGLEAVLADGTVISSMRDLVKNNTGYDLRQLFVGSEGTLGVVTRAVLRLVPSLPARVVALLRLPDLAAAHRLLALFRREGPEPNAFEAMWPDYYAYGCDVTGDAPLAPGPGLIVLVECAGKDADALQQALLETLAPALEDGLVEDAVLSQSEAQAQAFWDIREANEALTTRFPALLGFDVSLPQARMPDFVETCRAALAARLPDAPFLCFGHLGDGNLHLVATDDGNGGFDRAWIKDFVLQAAGRLGGSISAEHGIGTDKQAWLGLSRSEAEIGLMRRIKRALDPNGILNPGRLLPPTPATMPAQHTERVPT
ncbi:MAG: FAD-binding oxidoreductase [Paracoccaceae bacterium]